MRAPQNNPSPFELGRDLAAVVAQGCATAAGAARGRALPALAGALLAAGCNTWPVGILVSDDTIEVLGHTEYVEDLDETEVARAMEERLGWSGGRRPLRGSGLRRVDLAEPLGPFPPTHLDRPSHRALEGLRSGDLVLAKNPNPHSLGGSLTGQEFSFYDHTGILSFEGGGVWVYESWPRLHLVGFARDFASRFQGRSGRVPLSRFAARYETFEFVRLPDPVRNEALAEAVRAHVYDSVPYDPKDDPEDPALSCSEYVLEMLAYADYELRLTTTPVLDNSSLRRLVESLGFPTELGFMMPDSFLRVEGAESVGLISRHASLSEALALQHAYEALHGHFVQNSEIGSYLAFDNWRLLRYRDNVTGYLEWALGYFAANPSTDPAVIRRELDAMLPIFFQPTPAEEGAD